MAWVAITVLGVLVIAFAWTSGEWKRRSDFWEQAYLEKAGNLEALLSGIEELDDGVVRVWPREERPREIYH